MLDDAAVQGLYRCLLGRAPESADTIAAFRAYYPDFDAGRRAILTSDEFRALYAELDPAGRLAAPPRAILADALLRHAPPGPIAGAASCGGTLREGLRAMLARLARPDGAPLLAVAAGVIAPAHAHDLLPLQQADSVLIAQPDAPPAAFTLPEGGLAVRLPLAAGALAHFLTQHALRPQLAVFAGDGASRGAGRLADHASAAITAVLPCLADRSLIVLAGAARAQAAQIAAAFGDAPGFDWMDLHVMARGFWCLPVSYAQARAASPAAGAAAARFAPSLAVAAIMRNEAASIAHMLRSVLPIASFVALADTGSADGTIDAARAVLEEAKVEHVIASIPAGRFDDMRNAALDLIPPWIAWTLMLDADEALAAEDYPALLALLRASDADAIALPRYNFIDPAGHGETMAYPDRQVRLLRHAGQVLPRYSGAVHETVRGVRIGYPALDASAIGGGRGGPHIHHLVRRFRNPAEEQAKQEFYRELARQHG